MTFESIIERFQARKSGSQWMAKCPAHEDSKPSLAIRERDGKFLLHCHAGCTSEAVARAAGLELRELFTENGEPQIAETYDYTDEAGELLYQVVRLSPKGFRQRKPDGKGGWTWNLNGTRRVLYCMRGIRAAE